MYQTARRERCFREIPQGDRRPPREAYARASLSLSPHRRPGAISADITGAARRARGSAGDCFELGEARQNGSRRIEGRRSSLERGARCSASECSQHTTRSVRRQLTARVVPPMRSSLSKTFLVWNMLLVAASEGAQTCLTLSINQPQPVSHAAWSHAENHVQIRQECCGQAPPSLRHARMSQPWCQAKLLQATTLRCLPGTHAAHSV